jgi:hypothetical protein
MAVAITEEFRGGTPPIYADWHRTAPRRVVKKYLHGDPQSGWKAWQKYLLRRTEPETPPFLVGRKPPLAWGWSQVWGAQKDNEALPAPDRALASVLGESGTLDSAGLQCSMDALSLAYALPKLADELCAESWWQATERLHRLAVEAQQQHVDWRNNPHDVLQQQLLAGELPLALGYLFPEIRALRGLRQIARAALSDALIELSDGEGLPHARLFPVFGALFACWTRARWLGSRLPRGPWSRDAEYQYQWLVRHAIRLADGNGRFLLAPADSLASSWSKPMFALALELVGDNGDFAAAAMALPERAVPKHIKFVAKHLPKPSLNSDWSGICVMSNGWTPSAVRLAIAYADDPIQLELTVGGERLLAGAWNFETTCDGNPVHVVGEWENLCWQSDKKCDLLELGIELSDGLRLERQLLLAHKDHVLYLSDIVIAADGTKRRLEHASILHMDDLVSWQPECETRDGLILGRRVRAAVMPLALPEWRTEPRGGSLQTKRGCLVLSQHSTGRALCCPLLLDLKPQRAVQQRTWRQLTVGEWMDAVPRDVAVGFRAQSGRHQWLFYRSLGAAGNRTVLGRNIAGEFCAGRFRRSGKFDEWLEIEAV